MNIMKKLTALLLVGASFLVSCSEDDHGHDHSGEEAINEVTLAFTPASGGEAVTAVWFDADADGIANPTIETVSLIEGETYTLSITLRNTLEGEDKTAEIQAEAGEHMFFFSFTTDLFSNPTGNGNVDSRSDAVNYNDQDGSGQPLGLSTSWTTGNATTTDGEFQIILKHQPGLKTATSDVSVGGTDIDITFPVEILAGTN